MPGRLCCMCAEKLETAYEFKLQVEQADSFLREKCDGIGVKEEIYFNEVEVHLNASAQQVSGDSQQYQQVECPRPALLKDHLELLEVTQHDNRLIDNDKGNR